jgi:tRNA(Arg) A34 adenosine deaminase TadA
MCLAALYWSRCDAIFYGCSAADAAAAGFDDSFLYAEVSRPISERKIPTQRLLGDQAMETFDTWRAQTNKIEY